MLPLSSRTGLALTNSQKNDPSSNTTWTIARACPATGASTRREAGVAVNATASDNGTVTGVQFKLDGANLEGADLSGADLRDADGSAVMVHAGPDNFANIPARYAAAGPDQMTLDTGDSGARVVCGTIAPAAR